MASLVSGLKEHNSLDCRAVHAFLSNPSRPKLVTRSRRSSKDNGSRWLRRGWRRVGSPTDSRVPVQANGQGYRSPQPGDIFAHHEAGRTTPFQATLETPSNNARVKTCCQACWARASTCRKVGVWPAWMIVSVGKAAPPPALGGCGPTAAARASGRQFGWTKHQVRRCCWCQVDIDQKNRRDGHLCGPA